MKYNQYQGKNNDNVCRNNYGISETANLPPSTSNNLTPSNNLPPWIYMHGNPRWKVDPTIKPLVCAYTAKVIFLKKLYLLCLI